MASFGFDAMIFLFTDSHGSTLQKGRGAQPPPLQPDTRCSLEKLETALRFLGLNISEEQRVRL